MNIYSPKGGSIFWYGFNGFFDFLDFLFTRNGIPEWIFLWHKSEACQGLNIFALRSYDSVPQICILRNGFLSGERNSRMDFPFAWMSN